MRDTLKDTDLKETEEVKEFELGGDKYKMIISKKGTRMYYKNGKMTSEAEYAKSASML
jgi:flagellar basal body rod protein FlgG